MSFYFGEPTGDKLMLQIGLRELRANAKQWDHPVIGLFKYAEQMKLAGGDIFNLSKKGIESYCTAIVAMALKDDTKKDWWINMPKKDPPDGLVMTLEERLPGAHKVWLRGIEVVQHRDEPNKVFKTIERKMIEKLYEEKDILVCLILSQGVDVYDFRLLSDRLKEVQSPLKYVFVAFTGILLNDKVPTPEEVRTTYTLIQLLPVFETGSVSSIPHLGDFKERYDKGQESLLFGDGKIFYGTSNTKHHPKS